MPEISKLVPEVELPRPRSSGVAVVAVAALAMFTAVGASAFIVRVRMGLSPSYLHRPDVLLERAAAVRANNVETFVAAARVGDDRTALEAFQDIPELDPRGGLMRLHDIVVTRQMTILEDELARGDCAELRRHVGWLRQVAPEQQISVHVGECAERPRFIAVELAP
jgi:hypothetical protein